MKKLPMFKVQKRDGKWCVYVLIYPGPKPTYNCPLRNQFDTWAEAIQRLRWVA